MLVSCHFSPLNKNPCSFCSSDELLTYLKLRRPDLCLLEGEEEGEADLDEEEFVLIEDKGEEDEEMFQTLRGAVDDWEVSSFRKLDVTAA